MTANEQRTRPNTLIYIYIYILYILYKNMFTRHIYIYSKCHVNMFIFLVVAEKISKINNNAKRQSVCSINNLLRTKTYSVPSKKNEAFTEKNRRIRQSALLDCHSRRSEIKVLLFMFSSSD